MRLTFDAIQGDRRKHYKNKRIAWTKKQMWNDFLCRFGGRFDLIKREIKKQHCEIISSKLFVTRAPDLILWNPAFFLTAVTRDMLSPMHMCYLFIKTRLYRYTHVRNINILNLNQLRNNIHWNIDKLWPRSGNHSHTVHNLR